MRRKRRASGGSAVTLIADGYASLSRGHRRLADFILASPHEAALMTLERLAAAAGVSVATANRLGSALGLTGYPEFKALLRGELQEALRPVEDIGEGLTIGSLSRATPWAESIEQDLHRIQGITAAGGDAAFTRTCHLLATRPRVFVVGFGSSAFIAQYAAYNLSTLRDDCRAVVDSSGMEGALRHVGDAGPDDVAVQLAFARYSDAGTQLARHFKRRRVPLIAVTDSIDSPIAALAAETFVAPRKSGFVLIGGGAGAVAIIEALLRGTAAVIGVEEVQRRAARLTSSLGDALTPPKRTAANGRTARLTAAPASRP